MAQIVPMRFCNLSCAYCNEYDKVSDPVPIEEMLRRIDHLRDSGPASSPFRGESRLPIPTWTRSSRASVTTDGWA